MVCLHLGSPFAATMDLVMTLSDSEDDAVGTGGGGSSDDDDFEMGGEIGGDIPDPSASGNWKTANARTNLKKSQELVAPATLDAKLAKLAAKKAPDNAPPVTAAEQASNLNEARQARKEKKDKKKNKNKEEAMQAEVEEGADDPLTEVRDTSFAALKLSKPLLKAVWELGFTSPTPIQAAVLPAALRGLDICASAVTGSGKTAAFLLPALERLVHRPRRIAATRVLVLTPTRELAAQCEEMGRQLARFTDVRFALIVGGLSSKLQEADMRTRPDILVATPGRLIDLLRNAPTVGLDELEILILDEADRLLELGFEQEVNEVVRACPRSRQTLLFSATISSNVATLAKLSLDAPLQVVARPITPQAESLSLTTDDPEPTQP